MKETGEENPNREPSFPFKQESKDQTRAESPKCPKHSLMSSLNIWQIKDDIHFPIIVQSGGRHASHGHRYTLKNNPLRQGYLTFFPCYSISCTLWLFFQCWLLIFRILILCPSFISAFRNIFVTWWRLCTTRWICPWRGYFQRGIYWVTLRSIYNHFLCCSAVWCLWLLLEVKGQRSRLQILKSRLMPSSIRHNDNKNKFVNGFLQRRR